MNFGSKIIFEIASTKDKKIFSNFQAKEFESDVTPPDDALSHVGIGFWVVTSLAIHVGIGF